MKSNAFFLFFLLSYLPYVSAAELDLETVLQRAGVSSPRVHRSEATQREAEWKVTESWSGFLPSVSFQAAHLLDSKFMITYFGTSPIRQEVSVLQPYTSYTFQANWLLFDGLANFDRYRSARLQSQAAEQEHTWAQLQLRQDVKLKFYQALAAQQLAGVAAQNVKTLQDHLNKVTALRKNGAATNYDVLRVEVQLNEANSEQIAAEDNVVLAKKRLFLAMGVDDDGSSLKGQLPTPDNQRVDPLQEPKRVERADFQAQVHREEAIHKAAVAASKYWVPRISLNGQYQYYNLLTKELLDSDNIKTAYQLAVVLTWNLFDGMASIARSEQAAYQDDQMRATTEQAKLQIPYDFTFWKRRYLYSTSLYKAKLADVQKAEESVRLVTLSYRAGTRTSTEVIDAELELFRARAGVVNAKMNAVEALLNLGSTIGKEL